MRTFSVEEHLGNGQFGHLSTKMSAVKAGRLVRPKVVRDGVTVLALPLAEWVLSVFPKP
jgi:hypothetical protein